MTEREAFHRVIDRVRTYVPRASVIGLLLEHEEDYTYDRGGIYSG